MPLLQEYTVPLSLSDKKHAVFFRVLDDPEESVVFPEELPGLGSLRLVFELQDGAQFSGGGTYVVYGKPDETSDFKVSLATATVNNGDTSVTFDIPNGVIKNEWSAATTSDYPVIIQVELKEGTLNVTRKAFIKVIDSDGVGTNTGLTADAVDTNYTATVLLDWGWADEVPTNMAVALDAIAKHINSGTNRGRVLSQLNDPPISPTEEDTHLVGDTPTGAFSSNANDLVKYYDSTFVFRSPIEGDFVYDTAAGYHKKFNGTLWVEFSPSSGSSPTIALIDTSSEPDYPSATAGDLYIISVAGKIGGSSGIEVSIGDMAFCTTTNAGGDEASVGVDWDVIVSAVASGASDEEQGVLTSGATVNWNRDVDGKSVRVILEHNATFNLPTNIVDGEKYMLVIEQDAVGGRTADFVSQFKTISSAPISISEVALAKTFINLSVDSSLLYVTDITIFDGGSFVTMKFSNDNTFIFSNGNKLRFA